MLQKYVNFYEVHSAINAAYGIIFINTESKTVRVTVRGGTADESHYVWVYMKDNMRHSIHSWEVCNDSTPGTRSNKRHA